MATQKNKSADKIKIDIWNLFDNVNEEDKIECVYLNENIDNKCKNANPHYLFQTKDFIVVQTINVQLSIKIF
jgi:hypothetical protein